MISWEREEIFNSGDVFFARLLAEISEAQWSVYLEMYIFELDPFGQRVLETLKQVAARGVEVRVMVDGVGSPAWSRNLLKELAESKIDARIYRPYPWVRMGFRIFPRLLSYRRLSLWFQLLNRRNHRKVCILDQKIAWAGSFNISACHLREFFRENAWRDTAVRVEGSEVANLVLVFEKSWRRAWSPFRKRQWFRKRDPFRREAFNKPNALVRLNFTQFLRRHYYRELLQRIRSARKRVWIISAYFNPARSLVRALRAAAWSGIDVRILLPRKSDVRSVRWISFIILGGLLRAGVRIFEYLPSILHTKIIFINHWATIGSSNLNRRSLHHDLEVDIVVQKEETLEVLENQFLRDLDFSEEITFEKWKNRFWLERFLGRMFFFLRYWM
jgi:cardiolipin synthase